MDQQLSSSRAHTGLRKMTYCLRYDKIGLNPKLYIKQDRKTMKPKFCPLYLSGLFLLSPHSVLENNSYVVLSIVTMKKVWQNLCDTTVKKMFQLQGNLYLLFPYASLSCKYRSFHLVPRITHVKLYQMYHSSKCFTSSVIQNSWSWPSVCLEWSFQTHC